MLIHLQASVNKSAQNYFAKTVQSAFFCNEMLKLTTASASRSKYTFSLVKGKEGIQAVSPRTQAVGI